MAATMTAKTTANAGVGKTGRTMPKDFIYGTEEEEPHASRRAAILKLYPEIKSLFGYEWRTKYMAGATVLLQVFMSWLTLDWCWAGYLAAVYIVGATANHSLFLAVHELSHNLGAKTANGNKLIALMANLPILVPYAASFKPYHMDHHRYQGQDGVDTDIPTWLEGHLISSTSIGYVDHTFRKALFIFAQIFAYALRPMIVKPDRVNIDHYMCANYAIQLSFAAFVICFLAPEACLYFLLSTFFAGSIHPTAGHFIAEHYVMEGKAETYSYYGPLNRLAYNVGYHNEHHDFPSIPWSKLPRVREIAPEFYNDLPKCASWPGTLMRYIFDDRISPFSRVKRGKKHE